MCTVQKDQMLSWHLQGEKRIGFKAVVLLTWLVVLLGGRILLPKNLLQLEWNFSSVTAGV